MTLVALHDADDQRGGGDLSTSVGKALALLDAFDSASATLGVTELARRTGMPKSTAFRLLAALETRGYVERVENRYCLGQRLFELGNLVPYCRPKNLRDVALPYLSELYEFSHETVHLAVRDGLDVLYVEKLYGHDQVRTPSHVGSRISMHCSALGKAMLAHAGDTLVERVIESGLQRMTPYTITSGPALRAELETVRRDGVAHDREEARLGLTCVAAPIRQRGEVIAAISISGQTARFDAERLAAAVRRAACEIGDSLQHVHAAIWPRTHDSASRSIGIHDDAPG